MVAVAGTAQGQTGWYLKYEWEPKYFYFCLDKGEFVMLTGPMSEAEYLQCKAYDNGRSKYDTISVTLHWNLLALRCIILKPGEYSTEHH